MMMSENEKAIVRIKEKFDRQLKQLEEDIPIYEQSNNHELRIASKSLKAERDQLIIIVSALEKQIPMPVAFEYDDEFLCPACNFEDDGYDIKRLIVCPKCGQRLDFESEVTDGQTEI